MKKIILTSIVSFSILYAIAQETPNSNSEKTQFSYSFLWGLFESKDNSNSEFVELETDYSISIPESISIDTAIYEEKEILWGAVKWTEKKDKTDE